MRILSTSPDPSLSVLVIWLPMLRKCEQIIFWVPSTKKGPFKVNQHWMSLTWESVGGLTVATSYFMYDATLPTNSAHTRALHWIGYPQKIMCNG